MSKKPDKAPNEAFPGQHEGENVLMVFRHHPLVMRKPLIYGLLAVLVSIIPFVFYQIYAYPMLVNILFKVVIGVLIALPLYWSYYFIGWYYSIYIVTDQRLMEIVQVGMFNRSVKETRIDRIQNINYHIPGFQAVLFGYGNLTLQTYTDEVKMDVIHKPVQIHAKLIEIVRKHGASSTPAAFSGSIS